MNRIVFRQNLFLCVVLLTVAIATAQTQDPAMIQARVDEIVNTTLHDGEFVVNGARAVQSIPPSKEALAAIQTLGEAAIPALSKHLDAQDPREQQLAVRLIGVIGGSKIVAPLSHAIHTSHFRVTRMIALDFITSAPNTDFLPVVRFALNDQDALVRKKATGILKSCCPQELRPSN